MAYFDVAPLLCVSIRLLLSCRLPHICRMAAAVPSTGTRERNVEGKGTLPPRASLRTRRPFPRGPSTDLCSHLLGQNCVTCLHAQSPGQHVCPPRLGAETPCCCTGEGLMADPGWAQPSRETENGNWIGDQVIDCRTPQGWETVSKSGLYNA